MPLVSCPKSVSWKFVDALPTILMLKMSITTLSSVPNPVSNLLKDVLPALVLFRLTVEETLTFVLELKLSLAENDWFCTIWSAWAVPTLIVRAATAATPTRPSFNDFFTKLLPTEFFTKPFPTELV